MKRSAASRRRNPSPPLAFPPPIPLPRRHQRWSPTRCRSAGEGDGEDLKVFNQTHGVHQHTIPNFNQNHFKDALGSWVEIYHASPAPHRDVMRCMWLQCVHGVECTNRIAQVRVCLIHGGEYSSWEEHDGYDSSGCGGGAWRRQVRRTFCGYTILRALAA